MGTVGVPQELNPVTLQNMALMNMEENPKQGFWKFCYSRCMACPPVAIGWVKEGRSVLQPQPLSLFAGFLIGKEGEDRFGKETELETSCYKVWDTILCLSILFNAIRVSSYSSTVLSQPPGPALLAFTASQCDVLLSHPVCGLLKQPVNTW